MRNKIFAILYYSSKLNVVQFLGTGFMVSPEGDFITAGHTFGNTNQLILDNKRFKAIFIDDDGNYKCISFSRICYKHLKIDSQNPPTLYDIAYGCLEKGKYNYFKVIDKTPQINDRLIAPHYKNNNTTKIFGKSFQKLEKINLLTYFALPMSVYSNQKAIISSKSFSNCMELKQNSRIEKGASGCPLVNSSGSVSGLFFATPGNSSTTDIRYALNSSSILELGK